MNTGEELRIYAVSVHYLDTTTGKIKLAILVGNNKIPSDYFDTDHIHAKIDKTLTFTTPVLCLASQTLYAYIKNEHTVNAANARISLIAEISIVKEKK